MRMRINESIKINEYAEVLIAGIEDKSNNYKVEFTFSKDALLGLATNLLWMYDDIDSDKRIHIHIEPLLGSISGNQALGFFLAPDSPSMVLSVNNVSKNYIIDSEINRYKEIPIKYKFVKMYEVKEPASDESIEDYELGFTNIVHIRVLDKEKNEITNSKMQVIFKINYYGLKDFGNILLILANNYELHKEYELAHVIQKKNQYNLGVLLTHESSEVIIRCNYLGDVHDYAPHFGIV